MSGKYLFFRRIFISFMTLCLIAEAIDLLVINGGQWIAPAHAITPIWYADPDFSGTGRPGNREGAGSRRGTCKGVGQRSLESSLIALGPSTNIGFTVSEYPTFWFAILFESDQILSITFRLLDEQETVVYENTYAPGALLPGVIHVSPALTYPLKVDELYSWALIFHCRDSGESWEQAEEVYVSGWIQRVIADLEVERALEMARTPVERAAVYAKYGIWYDALTTLGNSYRLDPQNEDYGNAWLDLLDDVGLADIASEPVLECCSASTER